MRGKTVRITGIAALVLTTGLTGGLATAAPTTAADEATAAPTLSTAIGYLGSGSTRNVALAPDGRSTSLALDASADGRLSATFTNDITRELDLAARSTRPVLGNAFTPPGTDPLATGALGIALTAPDAARHERSVARDAQGVTLASGVRTERTGRGFTVMATADTAQQAYGRAIPAGGAVAVAGGGTSTTDGVPATQALLGRAAIAVSADRMLVTTDTGRIRVVPSVDGTYFGTAMKAGYIYTIASGTTTAPISDRGVTVDRAGNVITNGAAGLTLIARADGTAYGRSVTAGQRVRLARPASSTYGDTQGDGGRATDALISPQGQPDVDSVGNIFVDDAVAATDGSLVPVIRMVAAATGTRFGRSVTAGHVYQVARGFSHFTVDRRGALVGERTEGDTAHPITSMLVVAPVAGTYYGRSLTAGRTAVVLRSPQGVRPGDGLPSANAQLGVARVTARAGEVLAVAEAGTGQSTLADHDRVVVAPAREVTAFGRTLRAGRTYYVVGSGVGTGSYGLTDGGDTVRRVRVVDATTDAQGNVLTVVHAADSATAPVQVWVVARRTGTFYGRVMSAGKTYLLAGTATGSTPSTSSGTLARDAALGSRQLLTVDGAGHVVLGGNGMIRVIATRTETRYGIAMTAGRIYTLAGAPGRTPMTGDGSAATRAGIGSLADLAVHPATGDILLVENDGPRMRLRAVGATTGSVIGQRVAAGTIQTLAGAGMTPPTDGAPIADVELIKGQAVSSTPDGGLMLLYGDTLVRVDTAGVMTRLAGQGMPRFSPDGTPADQAWLSAHDLALGAASIPLLGGQDGVRALR